MPLSPFKLFGYFLQIIGMAVMFYGFFQLITSIQGSLTHATADMRSQSGVAQASSNLSCNPATDDLCGVDVNKEGSLESVYSGRVWSFVSYLSVGLGFVFLGLLVRSAGEIGGAFSGSKAKNGLVMDGRLYGPKGRGPFS